MVDVFLEIGIVIIAATLLAYAARFFRQPSIIAYIVAGIIIGPLGLKLIESGEVIQLFSELGIIFLLFIVGLHLDIKKLKDVGLSSVLIGIGQILFTSFIGYCIAQFWFDYTTSLYVAAALAFSSTVVVVKLLIDNNELSTLHGRIALGVLLVQDLVAIFALLFFTSLNDITATTFVFNGLKMAIFLAISIGAALYVIPRLFDYVASSLELLFLTALSWAFLIALTADFLGFSTVVGAFIAGITLASTPYALEVSNRIRSLRNFFVTTFFVALGMQIAIEPIKQYALPIIIFSLFVLIGNPLIVITITALYGYHKRTGFLTSICLAQISEFSLVLVALGVSLGHIPQSVVAIVATVATITIGVSTYYIVYDEKLYKFFKRFLFWKNKQKQRYEYIPDDNYDVLLCGYNRVGYSILKQLHILKKRVLVVDYDPDVIKHLIDKKVSCIYGDITDPEILHRVNLKKLKMCVSTILFYEDNSLLLKRLKKNNKRVVAVLTAHELDDALDLYDEGADYVILPHNLGGDHFSLLIEDFNLKNLRGHKKSHLKQLKKQKQLGHHRHGGHRLHHH